MTEHNDLIRQHAAEAIALLSASPITIAGMSLPEAVQALLAEVEKARTAERAWTEIGARSEAEARALRQAHADAWTLLGRCDMAFELIGEAKLLGPSQENRESDAQRNQESERTVSKHRCFEVTTPKGATIRIRGDPGMDQETLDALMALADAASEQFTRPSAPTEFRRDGWPLCPVCGEDELWSPLAWPSPAWPSLDSSPPMEAFIAAGLRCYKCNWSSELLDNAPSVQRAGLDSTHSAGEDEAGGTDG